MENRLVGLDAWRAVLLFYGILVHASVLIRTLPGDPMLFNVIQSTSRMARMQGFFVIAGFLAARSIGKRGRSEWLGSRMAQLLIPLAVVWLTFQRLTDWVNTGNPFASVTMIGHLWFLVTLAGFSLLTVVAQGPAMRAPIDRASRAIDGAPHGLVIAGLIAIVFMATLMTQATYMLVPPIGMKEGAYANLHPFVRTYMMVVFYALGHLLAQCDFLGRLRAAPLFVTAGLAMLVYVLLYDADTYVAQDLPNVPHFASKLILHLAFAVAGTCFSLAVFVHARSIRRIPRYAMSLSRASYTVYLVHLFYVTAAFRILVPFTDDHYLLFAEIVFVATVLSIVTHQVISASPLLRMLFNGKLPPRKPRRSYA
ncbi:acyltransferase family protein [Novosphingobium sp. BL-52-GroH]|uniref:acyltransferase family protein n=1 Tax=Novosphingobium sp. BL-52-GroH TaxID=3349877 RepID=UPI00384A5D5E